MTPRPTPSMRTWGKMARASSTRSLHVRRGRGDPAPPPHGGEARLLLQRRGCDLQGLDKLVVVPLLRVVGDDLEHEVLGLLGVALLVKLDGPRKPGILHLPDGLGDRLTGGHLSFRCL